MAPEGLTVLNRELFLLLKLEALLDLLFTFPYYYINMVFDFCNLTYDDFGVV